MNYKELIKKAHKNAKAKGFHDVKYSDEHYLVLIISEIGESIEAHRKGKIEFFNSPAFCKESFIKCLKNKEVDY